MNPQADLEYMPRQFPADPGAALATLFAYGQAHAARQQFLASESDDATPATPRQASLLDRLTKAGQLALRPLRSLRDHLPRAGGSGGSALPA